MPKKEWRDQSKANLRTEVERNGRSQAEFIREVFKPESKPEAESKRSQLNRWLSLTNEQLPRVAVYRQIAEATGRSVDWLLARKEAEQVEGRVPNVGLTALRQQLVETIYERLMEDKDIQALTGLWRRSTKSPPGRSRAGRYRDECLEAASRAVVLAFTTPSLVKIAKRAFVEKFNRVLAEAEREELKRLRHEAARR